LRKEFPVAEAKEVNRVDRWHVSCKDVATLRVKVLRNRGLQVMTQGALSGALFICLSAGRQLGDIGHDAGA
jgi:hypothetical protein